MTAVLEVGGLHWATGKLVIESVLGRLPGVWAVEANPVAQTATVTYDPSATSVAELRRWVEDCGYHCAGQSVPRHVCLPMAEPARPAGPEEAEGREGAAPSPHEVMGHGGDLGGMSMAEMVADMRRRFLVALLRLSRGERLRGWPCRSQASRPPAVVQRFRQVLAKQTASALATAGSVRRERETAYELACTNTALSRLVQELQRTVEIHHHR